MIYYKINKFPDNVALLCHHIYTLQGNGIQRPYSEVALGCPASGSLAQSLANESLAGYPKAITEHGHRYIDSVLSLSAWRIHSHEHWDSG